MAMTHTARGTASTASGGATSVSISPSGNIAHGSQIIVCVTCDNSGTNGADPVSAITDSKGNVYSTDTPPGLNDPGAASAGCAGRIASATALVSGGLTTSDTVTVSFGGLTTVATVHLFEITANAQGMYPAAFNSGAAAQTSATPSIISAVLDNSTVIVACVGREANGTRAADGDTTNGTWTNAQSSGVGVGAAGIEMICETKLVTASATQTYNPTFGGASADGVNMWAYYEDFARAALPVRRPVYPQLLPR